MKQKHLEVSGEGDRTCEICKGHIKERGTSKILCNRCARKEYFKNNPERYEQHRKSINERKKREVRLKRNLPLDHPRIFAEKGKGHVCKSSGYRYILKKGHANARNKKGSMAEHVFVMSEFLGRPLRKGENVHHKNGVRYDNRIENLELWHRGQPPGQRVEDKIKWCIEFLKDYGYKVETS